MRTAHHTFIAIGVVAAAVTVGAVQDRESQQPKSEPMPRATQATAGMPETSVDFVEVATDASQAEIAQAKLAMERASNPEVKAFAQRMMEDHQAVSKSLSSAASGQNFPAYAGAPSTSTAMSRLSDLSGAEFDREYMGQQVAAHAQAIRLFEHQAEHGNDAVIKAFAQKTLPTLRQHMAMAQEIVGKLGTGK